MSTIPRVVLLVVLAAVGATVLATPGSSDAAPTREDRARQHWQTVMKFKGVKAQACIGSDSSGYQEFERIDARRAHSRGVYTSKVIENGWNAGGAEAPFVPGEHFGPFGLGPLDPATTVLKMKIKLARGGVKKGSVVLSSVVAC